MYVLHIHLPLSRTSYPITIMPSELEVAVLSLDKGGMDGYVRPLLTPLSIMYCTRAVLIERKTISFGPISPNNDKVYQINETISSF